MKYPTLDEPVARIPLEGPKPFRVEYPYGLPDDSFRTFAKDWKSTCISYHRGVDPRILASVRNGNLYRYGTTDPRHLEMVEDMKENGYRGGDGQRIIIHVTKDDCWIAEGNHRMRAALAAELTSVDLQIHYLGNADRLGLLIDFDPDDPQIRVISD